MEQKFYGGIELGGTKTICAIGDASGAVIAQTTVQTRGVDETLTDVFGFFEQNIPIISLGVGSFGPINLDSSDEEFGSIHNSPKVGWSNVKLKELLEQHLKIPVMVDTDVNCAALGELYYGVAQHVDSFIYLTIGTGIGGGLVIDGKLVRGISHLEMGHMRIPHEPFDDAYKGSCTFHGDCFEGIASGFALENRYGQRGEQITDQAIWDVETEYISSALNNLMLAIGPKMIILGGGIMNHAGLIESIRKKVRVKINGYMPFPDLETYLVTSSSELNSALGAIKMVSHT